MSATQVEVIVPIAAETAPVPTVGDSVELTVADLAAFLPTLKGSVSSNVNAILSRYGYTPEKPTAPVKAPKKEKAAKAAVPECPATEGVPTAADYRLAPEAINYSLCLGRMQQGAEDKRWTPFVYREYQCSKSPAEGNTLCKMCSDRHEKFVASGKRGQWCGFINQAPPDWWHMLGTKWAEEKQPKFNGATVVTAPVVTVPAVEVAAETAVQEQAMTTTTAPAPTKEAAKAAKEAEKAAAKAAKEAEKEAAKAAKEAEKAAKKAAAPKKTTAKKTETVATAPAAEVVPAKADVTAEVAKSDGNVELINGEMYMVKNGNVYEYDELTQKPGDFVGRLRADRSIDGDAEEEVADESDSE